MESIVRNQLERLAKRFSERRQTLDVSDDAVRWLADTGYDPLFGARPVKRAIQTYVENPLAKKILAGDYPEGSTIRVVKARDGSGCCNGLDFV